MDFPLFHSLVLFSYLLGDSSRVNCTCAHMPKHFPLFCRDVLLKWTTFEFCSWTTVWRTVYGCHTYISFVVGDVLFTCSPETIINEQVCFFLLHMFGVYSENVFFFWVIACCFSIVMLRMQSENNNSRCSIGLNDERACSRSISICLYMCSWTILYSYAFWHFTHSNSQLCALNGLIKGEKRVNIYMCNGSFSVYANSNNAHIYCMLWVINSWYLYDSIFSSPLHLSHSLVLSASHWPVMQVSLMHSACESRTDSPISTPNQSMWVLV